MRNSFYLNIFLITVILFNSLGELPLAQAEILPFPSAGVLVELSSSQEPLLLKGIKPDLLDPFKFEFLLDQGNLNLSDQEIRFQTNRLVKYFLSALTMPEEDLWVNLSPYEKGKIIPESFGQTVMGRDLLAQDYLLKQVSAGLMNPDSELGKEFWKEIYTQSQKEFGTTQIPVNTFNKVWIMPDIAKIYEGKGKVVIVESRLKVMLDQDYLAMSKNSTVTKDQAKQSLNSQIIRKIILPQLEKEINQGKNFAVVRQAYNALVLSVWFKKHLRRGLLGQKYVNQRIVKGVNNIKEGDVELIYQRYLQAYKKGVFNMIKEEPDPLSGLLVSRKYFSGGIPWNHVDRVVTAVGKARVSGAFKSPVLAEVRLDPAMATPQNSAGRLSRRAFLSIAAAIVGTGILGGTALLFKEDKKRAWLENLQVETSEYEDIFSHIKAAEANLKPNASLDDMKKYSEDKEKAYKELNELVDGLDVKYAEMIKIANKTRDGISDYRNKNFKCIFLDFTESQIAQIKADFKIWDNFESGLGRHKHEQSPEVLRRKLIKIKSVIFGPFFSMYEFQQDRFEIRSLGVQDPQKTAEKVNDFKGHAIVVGNKEWLNLVKESHAKISKDNSMISRRELLLTAIIAATLFGATGALWTKKEKKDILIEPAPVSLYDQNLFVSFMEYKLNKLKHMSSKKRAEFIGPAENDFFDAVLKENEERIKKQRMAIEEIRESIKQGVDQIGLDATSVEITKMEDVERILKNFEDYLNSFGIGEDILTKEKLDNIKLLTLGPVFYLRSMGGLRDISIVGLGSQRLRDQEEEFLRIFFKDVEREEPYAVKCFINWIQQSTESPSDTMIKERLSSFIHNLEGQDEKLKFFINVVRQAWKKKVFLMTQQQQYIVQEIGHLSGCSVIYVRRDLLQDSNMPQQAQAIKNSQSLSPNASKDDATLGGIDFNPKGVNLQVAGSGRDFAMMTYDKAWKDRRIHSLTPVILSVKPVNVEVFLE